MQYISTYERQHRRKLIKEAGFTQTGLAKKLKVYPQQVNQAVAGLQPGLWEKIEKIIGGKL